MNRRSLIFLSACLAFGCSCSKKKIESSTQNVNSPKPAPTVQAEILAEYPHNPEHFTQGLEFSNEDLFESDGINGKSTLEKVDLKTGKSIKEISVPQEYFAEGLTVLNDKIYQLTWQTNVGFVYNKKTFEKIGEFSYFGEGWGLANDGKYLIMSDGGDIIRYINPDGFKIERTISVKDGPSPVRYLNELEFIDGKIYANIWQTNKIAVIDTANGQVVKMIDLSSIDAKEDSPNKDVLNGIAYDKIGSKLYITGKNWSKIYQIRIKE